MRNLENAGSSLQSIAKASVYLAFVGDFGAVNEAYLEYFTDYVT